MDPTDHWNQVYEASRDDEPLPWEVDYVPDELSELTLLLSPGSRILEIGCGRGTLTTQLLQFGFQVAAIDISEVAVGHARSALHSEFSAGRVQVRVASPANLPPSEDYDCVFDFSVLHHVTEFDVPAHLDGVASQLRPGGLYSLVCYSSPETSHDLNADVVIGSMGNTMWLRSRRELEALLSDRFTIERYSKTALGANRHRDAHYFLARNS